MYDITMTNMTCKEFKNTLMSDNILLCGEIESIGITKTKSGKNPGLEMAFVTLSDGTGLLDSVIFFPESYKANRNVLFEGNVIIVKGSKSKAGDSLIVDKAYIPRT
jgi:DNA polymerase III alpha subunit